MNNLKNMTSYFPSYRAGGFGLITGVLGFIVFYTHIRLTGKQTEPQYGGPASAVIVSMQYKHLAPSGAQEILKSQANWQQNQFTYLTDTTFGSQRDIYLHTRRAGGFVRLAHSSYIDKSVENVFRETQRCANARLVASTVARYSEKLRDGLT
jgi:hypothetical protein